MNQASRKSQPGIRFQGNLVNLIKVKERTLGTEATKRRYYLLVVEEEMMIAAAVMRNQTKESYGILNPVKKLM